MQRTAEIVLSLVIIGATLAFGGVQPFTYSALEIAVFALILVLVLHQARHGSVKLPLPIWPLLFALLIVFQIVPLPAALATRINPARWLPASVRAIAHTGSLSTLSIDPHATVLGLMKFLAYVGAFVLAAYVFDSRQRKSSVVRVLIFLGLFEAAYGIVQYTTGWQKIFTFNKIYYRNTASGTFINHNHFAGFIELTFPFVLAAMFYSFQIWTEGRRHGHARADPATVSSAGIQTFFYGFLLLIAIVAVIFSRSRAGILATIFTVVFISLLAQLKTRRKAWVLGISIFILAAVGYGLWIGLNPVLTRFEAFKGGVQYLQGEGRLSFWESTLGIIHRSPLLGTGLGTFRFAFPHYQTSWVDFTVTHAHSDYLELTSDTGLIGVLVLFVPIFALLVKMVRSFISDSRRYRRSITLGCIGSTVALLIHSVADFNLHIPSNAFVFAVVLGIGYKAACLERKGERVPAKQQASGRPVLAGRVHRKPQAS
ncbi:MAG: O-antigen ligase family protein [Terriglobia bacterium]